MRFQPFQIKWGRLGGAFVSSVVLELFIYRWIMLSPSPSTPIPLLLQWLIVPGVFLALVISGVHGGSAFLPIVWAGDIALHTAILYEILILAIRILGRLRQGKPKPGKSLT